ncbi:sarcosine oxidase subunit gamma [Aestuariivirga sp.]|uniref:sarcosine oxidase subunit gamma n=1 Tax=Aestuariivirga sp. TaxID=2650926 RepID=UPI00359425C3
MLERTSALAEAKTYTSPVLSITERPGFTLTQVSGLDDGFEDKLSAIAGDVALKVGVSHEHEGSTVMRIGPSQFWIVGPETDDAGVRLAGQCAVTPLSHGRVRIAIEGAPARDVLSKLMPLDFHPATFVPGHFAMTGIHHTPVTVHCTGENAFDIYAMRSFALNVWEVLTDAALEFAGTR